MKKNEKLDFVEVGTIIDFHNMNQSTTQSKVYRFEFDDEQAWLNNEYTDWMCYQPSEPFKGVLLTKPLQIRYLPKMSHMNKTLSISDGLNVNPYIFAGAKFLNTNTQIAEWYVVHIHRLLKTKVIED